jgi:hypothetical protein
MRQLFDRGEKQSPSRLPVMEVINQQLVKVIVNVVAQGIAGKISLTELAIGQIVVEVDPGKANADNCLGAHKP